MRYQTALFQRMRDQLDPRLNLVDIVAEVLDLSADACYRRIRGATSLSYDEAVKLAMYARISMSELAGQADTSAVFEQWPIIRSWEECEAYLNRSLQSLERIRETRDSKLYYLAKDIPIFYHFAFPKLAAFKLYVWMKSVYDVQRLDGKNYDLRMIPQGLLDIAAEQWKSYSQINSVEIWNDTTITSLLKQLEFYYEAGLLSSKEEALEVCDEFHGMMKIIYKQALQGNKVHAGNHEMHSKATYQMYYHEILIMDNAVLADLSGGRKAYFLPYAGVNYMHTIDPKVTDEMENYVHNQMRKSALISDISEKDRNRFFIRIRNQIDQLREKIEKTNPFM